MAKILILIGGHLCNSPRPQKEADVLSSIGYEVTVAGFWFDPIFIERDIKILENKKWSFYPVLDFQPSHRLINLITRLRNRIAREKFQRFGFFSSDLIGYGINEMFQYAKQFQADLTIVHFEGGLWVGSKLLEEGFCVGVDFEDWFSEDLLDEARQIRPIKQLKSLEKKLINLCDYCVTTSAAMARELSIAYEARLPIVIHNTFPWEERRQIDGKIYDRRRLDIPSIHWFSQTIGQGRGLEILFQSLQYISKPVEIHIRGNYPESARRWLEPQIPSEWVENLFIHPTVPNCELLSRISEHDIGLALEIPYCSNKRLTISNKLFQYLQAGLAIIATDTEGQSEIFSSNPQIGKLVPSGDPIALAKAINEMISDPDKLHGYKSASLQAAREKFCWEIENDKIVQLVKKIL